MWVNPKARALPPAPRLAPRRQRSDAARIALLKQNKRYIHIYIYVYIYMYTCKHMYIYVYIYIYR